MKNLLKTLFQETQSLKNQYIEMTREFAKGEHERLCERWNWSESQWCDFLGLKPSVKDFRGERRIGFPKNFYNTSDARKFDRLKSEARRALFTSSDDWMLKAEERALEHYRISIVKLADRIQKKGLDESKVTMKTGHVGVNIETTITDGEKTVRAWTIIAHGPVQRPHYRYLVK